jgi:hypothetical protein
LKTLLKILRKVLAVVVGIAVATIVMITIESFVKQWYGELPLGSDREAMRAFIEKLPLPAFLMILLSHSSGSFIASTVATLITGHRWLAGAIGLGVLYTLAGIANAIMIPLPVWFIVIDLPLYMIAALVGCYLAGLVFKPKPQTFA